MPLSTCLCKLYVLCPRLGRVSSMAYSACFMAVQGFCAVLIALIALEGSSRARPVPGPLAGQNWRKLAPVTILAVLNDYMEKPEQQVVVLFQVLAAELNFGYRFQCVRSPPSITASC